jgi:hypothetical protein
MLAGMKTRGKMVKESGVAGVRTAVARFGVERASIAMGVRGLFLA